MSDMALLTALEVLRTKRFDLSTEKAAQAEIHAAMLGAGLIAKREHRLGPQEILDVFVDGRIAVEVKLKGQKVAIFKQLSRYARHASVEAVVLVSNLSMGLPEIVEGKPAYFVSLGRAWV